MLNVKKRYEQGIEPFPQHGRKTRITDVMVEEITEDACKLEAAGECPRITSSSKRNKSAIPGSLASTGMIHGTSSEYLQRKHTDFVLKYYPSPTADMLKPLSTVDLGQLKDLVFPETVNAKKEDRVNACRRQ